MKTAHIKTRYGIIEAGYDGEALVFLDLSAGKKQKQPLPCAGITKKLKKDLDKYFKGKKMAFKYRLDLKGLTCFEKKALLALKTIPYGETRSYGWVAKRAGSPKASRAAGNAVGKNPFPIIIPCHRVIHGDGSIGGFSSGLKWKKLLHKTENISL
jgi:methylated-DNA-[protein]-cysteine S-methyltransferase